MKGVGVPRETNGGDKEAGGSGLLAGGVRAVTTRGRSLTCLKPVLVGVYTRVTGARRGSQL